MVCAAFIAGAVVAMLKRNFFERTIDSNTYLRFGVRPTIRQMAFVRSPLKMSMLWPLAGLTNDQIERVNTCFEPKVQGVITARAEFLSLTSLL